MSHPDDNTDNTAAPEPKKIGDLIDRLGVEATLEDDEYVTDLLVLAKVHTKYGIAIGIYGSENLQSYDRFAMLRMAADTVQRVGSHCHHDHGDE